MDALTPGRVSIGQGGMGSTKKRFRGTARPEGFASPSFVYFAGPGAGASGRLAESQITCSSPEASRARR